MNSLGDRLYNFEVTPPSAAWDRIAVDLDQAELTNKFPRTIYNTEITPPGSAWFNITRELDESAAATAYPGRLYNTEVVPPASVWSRIKQALDAGAPVRPVFQRIPAFARYAAAAVLVGMLAFFVIRFTTGADDAVDNTAQAGNNRDTAAPGNESQGTVSLPGPEVESPGEDDEALEQSKKMIASLDRPARRITGKLNSYRENDDFNYADFTDRELSQSIYAYEDHIPPIAERYVMLMTPDGKIIRVSKKWGELLCCVSGEEQDAECQDQLKKWREKLANSSLAPSPANFMDILGLVNSLEESPEL
jgi:hypothetical protein